MALAAKADLFRRRDPPRIEDEVSRRYWRRGIRRGRGTARTALPTRTRGRRGRARSRRPRWRGSRRTPASPGGSPNPREDRGPPRIRGFRSRHRVRGTRRPEVPASLRPPGSERESHPGDPSRKRHAPRRLRLRNPRGRFPCRSRGSADAHQRRSQHSSKGRPLAAVRPRTRLHRCPTGSAHRCGPSGEPPGPKRYRRGRPRRSRTRRGMRSVLLLPTLRAVPSDRTVAPNEPPKGSGTPPSRGRTQRRARLAAAAARSGASERDQGLRPSYRRCSRTGR